MNAMELAIESGLVYYGMGKDRARFIHHLEAFAALVAAHEREECAKLCDEMYDDSVDGYPNWQYGVAIRARGTT